MKSTVRSFAIVLVILSTGCATGITRIGYQLPSRGEAKDLTKCPIAIRAYASYDASAVDVLGSIKAYDTGFSTDCDEAYVLDNFCKDACALGADVVNVTEEHQPDFWSTCYRASAELLRFKEREQAKNLLSDAKYAPELIIDRAERARKRSRAILTAAVGGG